MANAKDKIIVFGGNGFLGRAIVHKLLARGCEVRSFQRSSAPALEFAGVEIIRGDIRDQKQVIAACENCNAIVHTAAMTGISGGYRDYYEVNVKGTQNVLQACRVNDIRNLVYTSSPSVAYPPTRDIEGVNESAPYPESYLSYYSATKAIAEKLILATADKNLSAICLRPHLIWGPGDNNLLPRLIKRARTSKLIQVGDGHNMVDLTYIENAAHAHLLGLDFLRKNEEYQRKVYFISDDSPVSLWQWINTLLERLDLPTNYRKMSLKQAWRLGWIAEKIYAVLPFEPPLTRFLAGQLAYSHYFDISAAKNELGYSPIIEASRALDDTVKWLKEY